MGQGEVIPISLVAHYLFCPRRAWLEAQGERTDTYQMQAGLSDHARVDLQVSRIDEEVSSVELRSDRLGVSGKTDVVELGTDGVRLREYKATPVRKTATVTRSMRIQLALQALCLEEMGSKVLGSEIYFTNHNQVVPVQLTDEDYATAEESVELTRNLVLSSAAPEPLEDDPRCDFCSHVDICLPDERYLRPATRIVRPPVRDAKVIHLELQGAYVHLKKGRMLVEHNGEQVGEIPLETVQAVQVHGNVNLSGGLIKELLCRDVPIQWCSASGQLFGWTMSSEGPNGGARQAQQVLSHDGCLPLATEFIASKIANQATQLRRSGCDQSVTKELRLLQHRCDDAHSLEQLLGIEGAAAATYFSHWLMLVKQELRNDWQWSGRSGRPASDPINAMLNYAYTLLVADEIRAIVACGLDPNAGFLHSSTRNKPALALDLMEETRAPVADSVVQTLINCRMVSPSDFTDVLGSVRIGQHARRTLIEAYERRMATEFVHPIFKYKVSWRRALEIQARQILGFLEHSQPRYQGMRFR